MIIDKTENGDLDFDNENYDDLKNGIVIFPEDIYEAKEIAKIKKELIEKYGRNKILDK